MTSDHVFKTNTYRNTNNRDNVRYIDPHGFINTKVTTPNLRLAASKKDPDNKPHLNEAINTSWILLYPSRELICFAKELIEQHHNTSIVIDEIQSENIVQSEDQTKLNYEKEQRAIIAQREAEQRTANNKPQ